MQLNERDTRVILYSAFIGFVLYVDVETELLRGLDMDTVHRHTVARVTPGQRSWFSCIKAPFRRLWKTQVKVQDTMDLCFQGRGLNPIAFGASFATPVEACKPKPSIVPVGPTIAADLIPKVARSCVHNEELAVVNRGLMACPIPDDDAWPLAFAALAKCPMVRGLLGTSNPPPNFEEWVQRFPAARQLVLRAARLRLAMRGMVPTRVKLKAFVKREIILSREGESYDPRLIQATDDEYLVSFGPHCLVYQKQLTASLGWGLDPGFYPIYSGQRTAEELGQLVHDVLVSFPNHVVFTSDLRRYDAHCGMPAQAACVGFYGASGMSAEGIRLAGLQVGSKDGRTHHGVTYSVVGTTSSGVPDTSIKGTLLNAAQMARRLEMHMGSSDVVVSLFASDDNFTICSDRIARALEADFVTSYGLTCSKSRVVTDGTGDFCSGYFWPVAGSLVFGPKPGRQMAKLFLKVGPVRNRTVAAREIALGMRETSLCVPLLCEMVERVLELSCHVSARPIRDENKIRARSGKRYDLSTESFFCRLYAATNDTMEECRMLIRHAQLGDHLDHPLFRRMVAVDEGDEL
jgi:hypothetical protein